MNIGLKRLLEMADHLEIGKLGHDEFCFSYITDAVSNKIHSEVSCGSKGCAIGEMSTVWPDVFCFFIGNPGHIYIKNKLTGEGGNFYNCEKWFELTGSEARSLFSYGHNNLEEIGVYELSRSASKEEVALNIRKFVKYKMEGK